MPVPYIYLILKIAKINEIHQILNSFMFEVKLTNIFSCQSHTHTQARAHTLIHTYHLLSIKL